MRRKPARKSARTYLAGLYSRLSKTASAGLRRLRGRANRAGPGHIAEDLAEFDYIEREAHDILSAVARLRARDLGETMAGPAYLPEPSYAMEPAGMLEPMPETLTEYAPETMANQARGRRRRNAAGGSFHVYSEGGFESGHRSRLAAERAARTASGRRGEMRVIATDVYGSTGPGTGHEVARYVRGRKV